MKNWIEWVKDKQGIIIYLKVLITIKILRLNRGW